MRRRRNSQIDPVAGRPRVPSVAENTYAAGITWYSLLILPMVLYVPFLILFAIHMDRMNGQPPDVTDIPFFVLFFCSPILCGKVAAKSGREGWGWGLSAFFFPVLTQFVLLILQLYLQFQGVQRMLRPLDPILEILVMSGLPVVVGTIILFLGVGLAAWERNLYENYRLIGHGDDPRLLLGALKVVVLSLGGLVLAIGPVVFVYMTVAGVIRLLRSRRKADKESSSGK